MMSGLSPSEALAMRILALEYSMQPPVSDFDPKISPLSSLPIARVPIIHLFGPSLSGQKTCVHIHSVLPYFFVPLPKDVKVARESVSSMAARLGASLERAMCIALKGNGPYVHDVCAVRGKPFYGYHSGDAVFFKIFLYCPTHIARAVHLLRTGAALSREFQPHEAHIPYLLQFFADYNLAGMGVMRLSHAAFRFPVPVERSFVWNEKELFNKNLPDPYGCIEQLVGNRANWSWSSAPSRLSSCELEADATGDHVCNALESLSSLSNMPSQSVKLVRSLAQICDDPLVAAAGPPPAIEANRPPPLTTERFQLQAQADRLVEILRKDMNDAEMEELRVAMQELSPDQDFLRSTPAAVAVKSSGQQRATPSVAKGVIDVNEDLASQSSDGDVRDILQWMARENELEGGEEEDEELRVEANEQQQEAQDILEASQANFAEVQNADERGVPGNIPVFAQLDGSGDEAPRHKRTKLQLMTPPPPPSTTPQPSPLPSALKKDKDRDRGWPKKEATDAVNERPVKVPSVHEYRRATANVLPLMAPPPPPPPRNILLSSPPPPPPSKPAPAPPKPLVVAPRPTPVLSLAPPPPPSLSTTSSIKRPLRDSKPAALPAPAPRAVALPVIAPQPPLSPPPPPPPPPPLPAPSPVVAHVVIPATPLAVNTSPHVPPTPAPVIEPSFIKLVDSPVKKDVKESEAAQTAKAKTEDIVESPVKSRDNMSLVPSRSATPPPPSLPLTCEIIRMRPAIHRTHVATCTERVAHYIDPAHPPPSLLPFFPSYLPNLPPYAPPLIVAPPPHPPPLPIDKSLVFPLTPVRLPPSRTDIERWLAKEKTNRNAVLKEHLASQLEAPTNAGLPQACTIAGRPELRQSLTVMYVEVLAAARAELRPDPALDPIHAIVLLVHDEEAKDLLGVDYQPARTVLMVASSPPRLALPATVRIYPTEELLLDGFVATVRMSDPDIIIGWEVQGTSLGYLLSRHARIRPRALSLSNQLGRIVETASPSSVPSAAGTGGEESYSGAKTTGIHLPGRIVLNLWRIMRSELKLQSFTIPAVAYSVLGVRLPAHNAAVMQRWWNSPALQSAALAHLFRLLQTQHSMLEKLDIIPRTAELARVFGIDFFSVLSRGSQYRVESMILRLSKPLNYILASPTKQQVAGQRAAECIPLVMEPHSKFYTSPVLVLDFQSLYPSIIIAYNYCFSTCLGRLSGERSKRFGALTLDIPPGVMSSITESGLTIAPNEAMFVTKAHLEGVLPRMLREILDTRVQVKAAMKKHSLDAAATRMLNARQLGLKMIANVTYGYTGASFSGRMPCVDIADAIVQTARQTLENAISLVHNTPKWRGRVVYSDTDSLFIELPGATREQAFLVGNEIAAAVTAANPVPVKLAFEKVYHPCVLVSKKRYVGYKWESPLQASATFEAKGIETVRRDTCPAVAKIMEKSTRLLFEKGELAPVRAYLDRQCAKLREDRVSLRELIFAKEVRLGTYSDRVPPPPAAIVAMKKMANDPQSEPRYGERVPYVVVAGAPSARLIDLVVSPETFISAAGRLRINSTYYITKCVLPSLERVLGLAGADVKGWFAAMPRARSISLHKHSFFADATRAQGGVGGAGMVAAAAPRRTLDQYYLTVQCPLCEVLMKAGAGLCDNCKNDAQRSGAILFTKLRKVEKEFTQLVEICMSCTGLRTHVAICSSLDCPVFFERAKISDSLKELEQTRAVLNW